MQQIDRHDSLTLRLGDPFAGPGGVGIGCAPAGSGRHGVKDGAIERPVDDFVVGHVCPLLNTPNLNAGPVNGYGAKTGALQ